jgi:hypothetical protein
MQLPALYLTDPLQQFDAAQGAVAPHVIPRRSSAPSRLPGGRATMLIALALTGVGITGAALQPPLVAPVDTAPVPLWRSEAFAEDLD